MSQRLVPIYRKPSYSPFHHLANDTAILDETVSHFAENGWEIVPAHESDVELGRLPKGDVYLNMCQGPLASEKLLPESSNGAVFVNRPESVLNCHRHRLVARLAGSDLSFPRTLIVSTAQPPDRATLDELAGPLKRLWLKRGDVHAERPDDVVPTDPAEIGLHLEQFAERGIARAAIQEHITGPVLKFYAVADGRFFRWYDAAAQETRERPWEVDEDKLRELAFAAASRLNLEVFGGDVAVPEPRRPVLIDINDWPSFAPFRAEASKSIADYVHDRWRKAHAR